MVVNSVTTLQGLLLLLLGIGVLALAAFALVDALRHRPDAFTAAGKLTKPIWSGILIVAVVISFIKVFNPLDIFGIICVVAAGVYLADVRPALRNITGGSQGPYGRW
jgi:drug/metabolite transporter (DMT)-like permease